MNSGYFEASSFMRRDFPMIDYEAENLNFLAHFHEEIEIVVVTDGAIDINCDGSCFTATKDGICIFMPAQIHSYSSSQPNKLHLFKFYCKHSLKENDFSSMRIENNLLKGNLPVNQELRKLTDEIVEEAKTKGVGYEYMVNSLSQKILCTLLRCNKLYKINTDEKNKQFIYINLLSKVNSYIDEHYSEPISLADISHHCNLSEYYFAHIFKKATGLTFINYLTAYRLDKARLLLLHTKKKIIDIALECGFSNTRAFNRAFQKIYSMTPTEHKTNKGLVI